jgi:D-alanine transaminase
MDSIGYYNGQFGSPEEMKIPMLDRAVFFGDGCYEAAFVLGGAVLDLDDHIARLRNSLRGMRIEPDLTDGELRKIIGQCAGRCGGPYGLVYWQISRGTAPRSHCFPPAGTRPNLLVTAGSRDFPDVFTPAPMITCEDTRYFHCDIKTLNLFPNVMANQAAREAGAAEAVFIRPDGSVTEGSHTNVCILKNGVLRTHENGNLILPGIAKKHVLEAARALGVPVAEKAFSREELFGADEIFVTGSGTFLKRASRLDGGPVGGRAEALYEAIARAYIGRAKRQTGTEG